MGTYTHVEQRCSVCLNVFTWDSQPFVKNQPAGNILLSASILLTGALPTMVLLVFQNMGCATIANQTFFQHQDEYVDLTISAVWEKHQALLLSELRQEKRKLVIGGDAADSPGHSAKFGSYTVMDIEERDGYRCPVGSGMCIKAIKSFSIHRSNYVQSNEVKGSYHMEKEGLVRSMKFLRKKKFGVATLVTNRHKQISKWVRENMPSTDHRYDIWHLAKCKLCLVPCYMNT